MSNKSWLVIHGSISLLLCASNSHATSTAQQLEKKLAAFHTFSAHFIQTSTNNGDTQTASGLVKIAKPNQFYWQTLKPNKQLFISNGKTLWQYEADLEQATRQPLNRSLQNTPLALLSGNGKTIGTYFQVKEPQKNSFTLLPKSNDQLIKQITLTFKQQVLQAIEFRNSLDQKTHINFSQQQLNHPISPATFEFKPPQSATILN